MKKSVVTYWITPDEEEEFLLFLRSTGSVVAYSSDWKETEAAVIPLKLEDYLRQVNPPQLMIAQENSYAVVQSHSFSGRIRYNLTAEQSAVITYRRGRLIAGKLGQSNLAFYYDVGERPPSLEKSFQAWGKAIFRWVKDRTPHRDKTGNYRLTSGAKLGAETNAWVLSF